MPRWLAFVGFVLCFAVTLHADAPDRTIEVWDGAPPGENTLSKGEALPTREAEQPPATRIAKITQPTLEFYEPPAEKRTGRAVLIFPGGAYNYVVTDKEGSEPARWLNGQGITGIVLKYRTKVGTPDAPWKRPLQDAQRAVSLVRARADECKLHPGQLGVMGFSAGGQLAALTATRFGERSYEPRDDVDTTSCRPDFALLIYPWNLWDAKAERLIPELTIGERTPPTFLLHTHDDSSTSLGSVYFYAALKQRRIPAELHVYQSGGHGYGLRPVPGTSIHTWPDRAAAWLDQPALKMPAAAR